MAGLAGKSRERVSRVKEEEELFEGLIGGGLLDGAGKSRAGAYGCDG